jgi:protein O-mannosyl-transferase
MNPSPLTRLERSSASIRPAAVKELLSARMCIVAALCLAVSVFVIYSPTLRFQFVLDDHRFTSDPRIQSSGHVWDYFANYVWAQFTGGPPSFYRPVFILWLRINFILNELSPWGWHLLSIAKHVVVATLLGLLTWKLLHDRTAALLAATLFALHPAQTESVAWVTVPDPLMSIFVLGALLLYLRYSDGVFANEQVGEKKSRQSARAEKQHASMRWLVASSVLCFAAMLAKETAIVFPAVIFLLAALVPVSQLAGQTKEENPWTKVRAPQALRQTLLFLCSMVVYLLMRLNALGGKLGAQTQHLPWTTIVLSWPATLWFYIKVLLWPSRSYAFADPTLADRFSVRAVLLPAFSVVCVIAILAVAGWWAWKKAHRELSNDEAVGVERALPIGATLLIFPILLALNLNALNPGDFLHGRYTYLPLAGLMLLAATGWHLTTTLRIPLLCAGSLLAVAFAALTIQQEQPWKDDLALFTAAHQLAPHNGPVAQNLANARVQAALQLDEEGRCAEAMPVFQEVTQEYPQDWFAWAGLGDCFVQLNDLPKAEESLHRAAELSHNPRVTQQWQQLRTNMGLPNSTQ